jgi:hypothetical protein
LAGSDLRRKGAVAKRNRWTKKTAMSPIRIERDSESVHSRAIARRMDATGLGVDRAWLISGSGKRCGES